MDQLDYNRNELECTIAFVAENSKYYPGKNDLIREVLMEQMAIMLNSYWLSSSTMGFVVKRNPPGSLFKLHISPIRD